MQDYQGWWSCDLRSRYKYDFFFTSSRAKPAGCAKIKADLVEKGTPIGDKDADIFIAAYCMNNDYTLVTDNISDFKRIDGLNYVNWA